MSEPPVDVPPVGGGPCAWPIITRGVPNWDDADPEQQATAESIAVYVMWALSGRRFGVCTVTLRPGVDMPAAYCTPGGDLVLLPGPVVEVDAVTIDGEVLDPGDWLLYGNELVRAGGWLWPEHNDLSLPATEEGTWSITYRRGTPVPVAGQYAAGMLAGEILKSMRDVVGCRLPSRAASVSREGVNVEMIDAATFLEGGRTGIPEVDLWLAVVNPNKLAAAPQVWSPDVGHLRAGGPT